MSPYFRHKILCLGALSLLLWAWTGPSHADTDRCPKLQQVMKHFSELSRVPRISEHEARAVDFVQQEARQTGTPFWSDPAGNTLALVPATGKYRDMNLPPIGLQSHEDMVPHVEGVKPGTLVAELLPHFENGVELEEVNGWLQSKNRRTTLGADDGWGVATMLRYMHDLTIPHPALALLFTIDEERGLIGAKNLGDDLRQRLRQVPVLINLDSTVNTETSQLCHGCQGGLAFTAEHSFSAQPVPAQYVHYEFSLQGLTGGHSGLYIHLGRASAVKLTAKIFSRLLRETGPSVLITDIQAGTPGVLNAIPNSFTIRLAMPSAKADEVNHLVESLLMIEKWDYRASENIPRMQIESHIITDQAPAFALPPSETQHVLQTIQDLGNGVLVKDARFPNNVLSSSNIGFWTLSYNSDRQVFQSAFGVFARSFDPNHFQDIEFQQLMTIAQKLGREGITILDRITPWYEDPKQSWLIQKIQREFPHYGAQAIAGITELAVLQGFFPETKFIGLGPQVLDEHNHKERINLESWGRTIRDLDQMLLIIADSPEFAAGPRLDP